MHTITPHLPTLVQQVRLGGVIAYPTEAVFGLGCDPANLTAVQHLLALKQRPAHKGLILLAADLAQLEAYLLPLDPTVQARVEATWPGPVTWLLPARPTVSPLIRGDHGTLAVRVSAHPVCRELCLALGHPIVSSSANRADQAPARTAQAVYGIFGQQLSGILDAPVGNLGKPTEIRDGGTGEIVRPGG